jgi:hypothetical protein
MQDRRDSHRFASQGRLRPTWPQPLLIGLGTVAGIMAASIFPAFAAAQDVTMPAEAAMESWDASAPPVTNMGEGSFYSQDLGTTLRARYNSQSYAQDGHGNLDLGTMQVVTFEDAIAFFDGQVTLSDVNGVGFNVGVGYRWLSIAPYSSDPERINGISLWGDGTHTEANNFFPQLGISLESLGEFWDFRGNGYIPIGQNDQVGAFVPTGEIGFQGNFISELAIATLDSSFYVAEVEVARRLGAQRDAWVFGGSYVLANEDQDTAGFRTGVRGYAYPDLLLQLAVTHDDIFDTNTTFSLTWFIGRTRTNFHPACGVPDRFREPVMRNDYVALAQSTVTGGTPLTDVDGDPFRVVHVNSNAAGGGDGTFENPLNNLNNIAANSQIGDIVYAHANSEFTGQAAVLQAEQRFLGEGNSIEHTIVTQEEGTIPIPETFAGATTADRPMILAALGDAITIDDLNEVANFTIDGGTRAIVAGANGAGNPSLHDLTISDTTGDAIVLTPFVRTDTADADNDGNVTEQTVAFNVNIEDVTFDNIGGTEMNLNADTGAVDVTDPNVTLQEAIVLRDIDSTNGNSRGLFVQNTHSAGTLALTNYTNTGGDSADGRLRFTDLEGDVTITNADITGGTGFALDFNTVATTTAVTITQFDYDGLAGAAGGIRASFYDGTLTASTSTLKNGTLEGVSILEKSDGTFTFQSTVTMESIDGTAFHIDGGALNEFTGVVSVANAITNDTGRSVDINNISGAGTTVTFNGNITDTGTGIRVNSNAGGNILFSGDLSLTTEADQAVTVTDNTGADISFGGQVDITTTDGNAFIATGGGTLTANNTGNSITTTTGRIEQITGMTISSTGVNFADVSRTAAGATTNAVHLQDNTGGPILVGTVGDNAGVSGTIEGGTVDAIVVQNSANVTVSGLEINNTNAVAGVSVTKSNSNAMTVNLNDLKIDDGNRGVNVVGTGGSGSNLTMTVNDLALNSATDTALRFDNVDAGTIQANNLDIDGGGTTDNAGVLIQESNATFTFDANTSIQGVDSTGVDEAEFRVDGGTGTINMAGDITNTVGRSVHVENVTGGTINFQAASSITDTAEGMLVNTNTGGTFSFLGTNDFDNGVGTTAVTLTSNTGASMTFAGLNILSTGTGQGFVATGGGTLSLTGTSNIINSDDGLGLQLEGMTIGAVDFQSVTVDDGSGGPVNAIILRNLTGGQVAIGSTTGGANTGGMLRTTGDAIILENVQNVDLRQMQILATGGAGFAGVNIDHTAAASASMDVTIDGLNLDSAAGAGTGIDVLGANNSNAFNLRLTDGSYDNNVAISITGSSAFAMLVDNVDINTSNTSDIAFALDFSGSAQNGDVTFRNSVGTNTNDFVAANASALSITSSGGTAKTITLLVEEGNFSNSSAASPAANFLSSDNTLMNATIRDNTFDDANAAGSDFTMTGTGAQARIRLNLGDDSSALFNNAAGNGEYNLVEDAAADFDVFDKTDTFAGSRNTGTVVPQSPAGVPNAAAFDDSPVAPPLPVVP